MSSIAFGENHPPGCTESLDRGRLDFNAHLTTRGSETVELPLHLPAHHEWLIEVREAGDDAFVEIRDSAGHRLTEADHPERRTGTRRLILHADNSSALTLRISGKEHAAATGTVAVAVFDWAALDASPVCLRIYRELAAADAEYAAAQHISLGNQPAGTVSTQALYASAAEHYEAAQTLLEGGMDVDLRAEVALALAGIWYFDLEGWRQSVAWAQKVIDLPGYRDRYRRARAQAIIAAAWIEMATDAAPSATEQHAVSPHALLKDARHLLEGLSDFHHRRRESYDAALQVNNIALSYLYEGRSAECVAAARAASDAFARLRESPRQAIALQNEALCDWGLGHLPQALEAFNRALTVLESSPYPQLYLGTLNNTGLLNFALGRLDDSLRLNDRALELAVKTQNRWEEAQSLYGIGVTYYALGDRDQAAAFLEKSLVIRTADFDGRGRRATLRALATVYADRGHYRQAIDCDRESLTLASEPIALALGRIQLAAHTSLDGRPDEALVALDELLKPGAIGDALVVAQARLARAVVEREQGDLGQALEDLRAAIPVFHRVGTVTDQFSADLERSRVFHEEKRESESLTAVDEALSHAESLRLQTANPELRAQMQVPVRAAYELKLDLLWAQHESAVALGQPAKAARLTAAAFQTADSARARSFRDIASEDYGPSVHRALEKPLARRERLYRELTGLQFSLESRLDLSGSEDLRAIRLRSEIAERQRQVDTLNTEIASRIPMGRELPSAGRRRNLRSGADLPVDTAIVAYWIGSRSAYSWAHTPAGLEWVKLVDPGTITAEARTFHDALKRLADVPRAQRIEAAERLYELVLRPLETWLAPYRHWYVVPDAALNYVPFAALRRRSGSDATYLVASHDIALTPAAWILLTPIRPATSPPPDRALLVSDPVYDHSDQRFAPTPPHSASSEGHDAIPSNRIYQRLPATAKEAEAVRAQLVNTPVEGFDGFNATRARLLQLDWSRYRIIHIASHGFVDARIPQLSSLILSAYSPEGEPIDDSLRAADLSTLHLNAEVAVFSGCETALGKEVLSEGMLGLSYTALARGARTVISSLWSVPDEMTAVLMTDFYRHLSRDSMSPTSSLSSALRSALLRNPSADPALWAAFQIAVVGIPPH